MESVLYIKFFYSSCSVLSYWLFERGREIEREKRKENEPNSPVIILVYTGNAMKWLTQCFLFNYYWRIKWILRWMIIIIETRIHQNGNRQPTTNDIIRIIKMECFFSFWRFSLFQGRVYHLSKRLKWANKLQDHGIFGHIYFDLDSTHVERYEWFAMTHPTSFHWMINFKTRMVQLICFIPTQPTARKICICKQHEWTRATQTSKHQQIHHK